MARMPLRNDILAFRPCNTHRKFTCSKAAMSYTTDTISVEDTQLLQFRNGQIDWDTTNCSVSLDNQNNQRAALREAKTSRRR